VARIVLATNPIASWLASSPAGAPAEIVEVWGRARPLRSPSLVDVQVDDGGSGDYRDAGAAITDANGIFDLHVAVASGVPALVRFRWVAPDGSWQTSPPVAPITFPVT
jgi:hypothetical protein